MGFFNRIVKLEPQPYRVENGLTVSYQEDIASWAVRQRQHIAARLPSGGYGACNSCKLPWYVVTGHVIRYSESGGCFAICESCWKDLGWEKGLPFYEAWIKKEYPTHPEYLETVRRNLSWPQSPDSTNL
jgi:hypothetical protein